MKKRWGTYVIIILSAGFGAFVINALLPAIPFIAVVSAVLFFAFALWWTAYYVGWSCNVSDSKITVRNGVFFRNVHVIPRKSILWTTLVEIRLPYGKTLPLFTLLHTSGGKAVIFGEILW